MADKELGADEMQIAAEVHEAVVRFLKLRYKWVGVSAVVISSALGMLLGFLVQNRMVEASLGKAFGASEEANRVLAEVRMTNETLERVRKETPSGALADISQRVEAVSQQIDGFKKKLDVEFPDDIVELSREADAFSGMKKALDDIKKLVESSDSGALTAAFFKIYDFAIRLDVTLYIQANADEADLLKNSCSDLAATVELKCSDSAKGKADEDKILAWKDVHVVEVECSPTPDKDKTVLFADEKAHPDHQLRLTLLLPNVPSWWTYRPAGSAPADVEQPKKLNLKAFELFDTVSIRLGCSGRRKSDVEALLIEKPRFKLGTDRKAIIPKSIRVSVVVNQETFELALEPQPGAKADEVNADYYITSPLVDKEVKPVFQFDHAGKLFAQATSMYIRALRDRSLPTRPSRPLDASANR